MIDVGREPMYAARLSSAIYAVRDQFTLQSLVRSRGKRERRPGKHSLPRGENPIRNNGADVAELVDARDLKFSALFESPHLFWKTRPPITIETDGTKRDLENRFRDGLRDHSNEVTA